ncbi:MAG: ATP-binding protein [Spirochaetia bacterium]|jgi:lon-related putative ATP-dependent protease|nr:ATP-binding protein [Spirochaetia bacterium]
MNIDRFRLTYDELHYTIPVDDIRRLDGDAWGQSVIGQPRALEALKMGTAIRAKGYNILVTGAAGTGRRTAVMKVLSDYRPAHLALHDYAYVYNFSSPLTPKAVSLPAGKARAFKKDVHEFVENVKKLAAMQAESGDYKNKRDDMVSTWEKEENARLATFESELAANGFQVVQVQTEDGQTSTDILPLRAGSTIAFDELQGQAAAGEIPEEEFSAIREHYFGYMDQMRALFMDLKRGRSALESQIESLRRDALRPLIHDEAEAIKARHDDEKVRGWLEDLEKDFLSHLYLFNPGQRSPGERKGKPPLARYGVNILADNEGADKPPVVFDSNPNYAKLFGTIDLPQDGQGDNRTAYLKIRPGSILKASGGFLVMQAEDLVQDEDSWNAVKRVLRSGKLEIQGQPGPFGSSASIKPEPFEVDVKIVLIGGESAYDYLYQTDPDFQKLFKVCAEFDDTMPCNDDTIREYVVFVRKITLEEGLLEPSLDGIAAIVEYGVRLSEKRSCLSTRFSRIADLIREADYCAELDGKEVLDADAVDAAQQTRARLANLPEEKLADMIVSGEILLQVDGEAVGRVNGLAVHDRGYYAFGLPAVISAQVSPGESGVINIEGESGLSGEIYDKAVLIVEGFLRSRYARDFPLAVSASICFEQSYTAIEGDSASSTAVYALLSAIARVPLRQNIAVTGSVNQMGQIQPVGGISEKVEGFYNICKKAGFTGTQGVMIPKQNIGNLILCREVLAAIKSGKFSIYAVSTIDEGIQVLTSLDPGAMGKDGTFPAGSFNAGVANELRQMAETVKEYMN